MRYQKNKKRGPVRSKKVICDGTTFASGLEKYMYQALKKANIKNNYWCRAYKSIHSSEQNEVISDQTQPDKTPTQPNANLSYSSVPGFPSDDTSSSDGGSGY